MTTFQRPAPEIDKIVEAWTTWTAGGDALPGRTMADLKIGGLDTVLETLATDNEAVTAAFESWMGWEKGRSNPAEALVALTENGLGEIVEALTTTA